MIIDWSFNYERLIEFLQTLVKDARQASKTAFLILDNRGVHYCRPAKA